ncbi:MAG: nucleoside hydrolase [Candidatus Rokuibacteriota bacterium]|nr:MAG: nucleoside hydrolase [Candidatus Rokubacteria bacterium]
MRPLLINTDTSAGDAIALLLALQATDIEVVGITITCGNSGFDQQVENALYTLEVAGRGGQVPVFPGCRDPLLGRYRSVPEVWGADGMGDSSFPRARQRPERRHAVDAITDLAQRYAGELEVVSLGPLTNLAVALARMPEVARLVKTIYAMSGCLYGQGNITLGAEYNAWVDPEAARIVYHAGANVVLVPWEVAAREAFVTPEEEAEIARLDTVGSRFYMQVTRVMREYTRARNRPGLVHADVLAMLVPLVPALVRERRRLFVDIEVAGELGRGVTFFDWVGTRPSNAEVVLAAERRLVVDGLRRALALR